MKKTYKYNEFRNQIFFKNRMGGEEKTENHYMLECEVTECERQGILDEINISLFNLNNEDVDQNLKCTGHQLMIISAGIGVYRVNPEMMRPTK